MRLISTLGGLDTIVFAGGIGERSPKVRSNLRRPGISGIETRFVKKRPPIRCISNDQSRVEVRMIPTDEEIVIARIVCSILHHSGAQ